MRNERQYGIEIIRVLSMGMVIGLHFFLNCSIPYLNNFSMNFCITWIGEAICYVSVDLFVLISGYFGVRSRSTNYRRIFSLMVITWFYSYLFLIIFALFIKSVSFKEFNISIFPLINGHYWFVTVYIMLMLFQSLLNKFYDFIISKKQYKWIILLVVLFCIIPTFFPLADANLKIVGGTNFLWFITLYIVGGIIYTFEKHIDRIFIKIKIICLIFAIIIPIVVKISIMYFWGRNAGGAMFYHHNSAFIFIASIMLFLLLKNLKLEKIFINRILVEISSSTFGIYLIHENIFVKKIIWEYIKKMQDLTSNFWSIFMIFWIVCIYIICFLIDYTRRKVFLYLNIENKVYSIIYKMYNYLRRKKYEGI